MQQRTRRLSGLVLASCFGHLIVGLGGTLVTGTRAWPALRLEHELALPAVSLMLLVLAAFLLQGFAALRVVHLRRRAWWLVSGAVLPVAALGFLLAFDALRDAEVATSIVPTLAQPLRYVHESGKAVTIALSASTASCLLASNAAVLFGVTSLAQVERVGRGLSVRVALWSGLVALAFVVVVQLTWQPMRWTSLPAGWVPAIAGLLAAMLAAQALSGHHVAEDTLRASLPPGKSRAQRTQHLQSGRNVAARLSELHSVLIAVVGAALASAVFSGIVTELAAFRGMLLAAGDTDLLAATRATRILTALDYLDVPFAVHAVHALPALVVAFALAAISPAHWVTATRRALPELGLSLGGAVLATVAANQVVTLVPRHVEQLSVGYANGLEATLLETRSPFPRPDGLLVVVEGDAVRFDGRVWPLSRRGSLEDCQRIAVELGKHAKRTAPTYAVSPEVPYSQLKCLATAMSAVSREMRWLVEPRVVVAVPEPWRRLAEPFGAVNSGLWSGVRRSPSLRLEASQWVLTPADGAASRLLEGPVEQRLKELLSLAPTMRRVDVEADGELASDIVLRVIANLGVRTNVALVVGE